MVRVCIDPVTVSHNLAQNAWDVFLALELRSLTTQQHRRRLLCLRGWPLRHLACDESHETRILHGSTEECRLERDEGRSYLYGV